MLANIWANQNPGENPEEKGKNKAYKEDQPHHIEEARRPSRQHFHSRARSDVLLLPSALVRIQKI